MGTVIFTWNGWGNTKANRAARGSVRVVGVGTATATPVPAYASGTTWVNVGSPGFSAGTGAYTSLAFSNGTPYVVYEDWINGFKATVMAYNGSSWTAVGNPGFSGNAVYFTSLAFSNGTPYVAYEDVGNFNEAAVT